MLQGVQMLTSSKCHSIEAEPAKRGFNKDVPSCLVGEKVVQFSSLYQPIAPGPESRITHKIKGETFNQGNKLRHKLYGSLIPVTGYRVQVDQGQR